MWPKTIIISLENFKILKRLILLARNPFGNESYGHMLPFSLRFTGISGTRGS